MNVRQDSSECSLTWLDYGRNHRLSVGFVKDKEQFLE